MLILPNLGITLITSFNLLVGPIALEIEGGTHTVVKFHRAWDLKGHQPLSTEGVPARRALENLRMVVDF